MTDLTPNLPEIVAEISALFERYEQALIDKNVEVLDASFWNSPYTIRYALGENGYGFDEIHAHRAARPPGPARGRPGWARAVPAAGGTASSGRGRPPGASDAGSARAPARRRAGTRRSDVLRG